MPKEQIGTFATANARLHYEVRGTGPTLLFIPGGNGEAGPYEDVAKLLADRFTVVTYDRRGFSRSKIEGPVPEGETRLALDSEDVHFLLDQLSPGQPAYIFGSSSGAIVALDFLARYPKQVLKLVAHEPPFINLLPEKVQLNKLFEKVYEIYRQHGVRPALRVFMAETRLGREQPKPSLGMLRQLPMFLRIRKNLPFWLEHELRPYPYSSPNLGTLHRLSDKLILAGGQASKDLFPYQVSAVLAKEFGKKVVDLPGGHTGYMAEPRAFAAKLADVLLRQN